MSLTISKPITRREFVIDYISPLICEEISGQSGDVEINILPFDEIPFPTGLLVVGDSTLTITWNAVKRGLCYNVYRSLGPDGPYQLISSCQTTLRYDDDPGPGSWYYRISTITPDGEGPLSDFATTSTTPIPPPDPGDCPAESGTPTPDQLVIEEDTNFGDLAPDTSVNSNPVWGTFSHARFKITYTGGAFQNDDNPHPAPEWKFLAYLWEWNGGTNTFDPDLGGSYGAPSQGEVEAEVPIGLSQEFEHTAGTIGIDFAGAGSNPVAGSPNPTFNLRRTGTYPDMPARVRIQDYDPSIWSGDACLELFASGDPAWDGVFDQRVLSFGVNVAVWQPLAAVSILGGVKVAIQVEYIQDHPTSPTGGGWRMTISSFAADLSGTVLLWSGIKGIDLTPDGRYYREAGCKTGPECLIVEEY